MRRLIPIARHTSVCLSVRLSVSVRPALCNCKCTDEPVQLAEICDEMTSLERKQPFSLPLQLTAGAAVPNWARDHWR